MVLLSGAMCEVRNDSCSRKHKYARSSHGMASESLSRAVDLCFAQEFCFFKQEHGPPRGSKQAETDVFLSTILGPLRRGYNVCDCSVRTRTRVAFRIETIVSPSAKWPDIQDYVAQDLLGAKHQQ